MQELPSCRGNMGLKLGSRERRAIAGYGDSRNIEKEKVKPHLSKLKKRKPRIMETIVLDDRVSSCGSDESRNTEMRVFSSSSSVETKFRLQALQLYSK